MGFDRIRALLAAAVVPARGGADPRSLLLSVLEEIDRYAAQHPGMHDNELLAMRQIAEGALVID